MNNAIPEEVELMANELVRVCARYHRLCAIWTHEGAQVHHELKGAR